MLSFVKDRNSAWKASASAVPVALQTPPRNSVRCFVESCGLEGCGYVDRQDCSKGVAAIAALAVPDWRVADCKAADGK
eukprot:12512363-Alexandrium_andersonii.AAC.1